MSEETSRVIDSEVHEFVMRNYRKAKAAIEAHREQLVAIAEALLIRETLDGNDVAILMKGGTLPPPKAGNTPSAPAIPDEAAALDPGLNPALKPA
jgi:cell division protease FtsH